MDQASSSPPTPRPIVSPSRIARTLPGSPLSSTTAPPAPYTSLSSPTNPRRRVALSTSAKRSSPSMASRSWNRRLSVSAPATPAPDSERPSQTATPGMSDFSGHSFVGASAKEEEGQKGKNPFALSGLRMEVDSIEGAGQRTIAEDEAGKTAASKTARRSTPRRIAGSSSGRRERKKKAIVGMNDLPDELLLRIFGFLNDQQGFRPMSSRISTTPEWYTPPLRMALVCQRWRPLASQIFYRYVKISDLKRIRLLYETFSNTDLSLAVRYLSIDLPYSAVDKLGIMPLEIPTLVPSPLPSAREADSDVSAPSTPVEESGFSFDFSFSARSAVSVNRRVRSATPSKPSPAVAASTTKKKPRGPLLPKDQLRAIFQSCSQLLSFEISGVPPALLFGSSSSTSPPASGTSTPSSPQSLRSTTPYLPPPSPSALHHLHLLRLSTVTSLTLRSRPTIAGDAEGHLTSTALRDALLALTGLRNLTLKGYVSEPRSAPLDFAPTKTFQGLAARPLPSRARTRALLPLKQLTLIDCAISPADLVALLRQVRPGSLRDFALDESFQPLVARERRRAGLWDRPSVEGLNQKETGELLGPSVEILRVTLHNWPVVNHLAPVVTASPSASTSASIVSSPPRSRSLQETKRKVEKKHIIDGLISQLSALQTLDLGGSVVSPLLFLPPQPTSLNAPFPSAPTEPPLPSLPKSLRTLTLRSCAFITPSVLQPLLNSLTPPSASSSSSSTASTSQLNLQNLLIYGSTEYGWASPSLCWETQKGCWNAGVRWTSGAQGRGVTWTAPGSYVGGSEVNEGLAVVEGGRRGDRMSGGW
ncbi:hypothetical protein JCM11641_001043 [Rhodosporidiobolus odoratus]